MEKDKQTIASKTFRNILSDGFNLFFKNYVKLIIPIAIFFILSIVVKVFLLTELIWLSYKLGPKVDSIINKNATSITEAESDILMSYLITVSLIIFLEILLVTIFTVIAMCSVSLFTYKKYMHEETDFISEFKKAFNSKMLLVIFLIGICVPLALFQFMFPGIIVFSFFIFLIYTYNMEDTKENPISEARLIGKGSFWNIIFIYLIAFVLILIVNEVYQFILFISWDNFVINNYESWLNPATRNYGMLILNDLIRNLIIILLLPLFICLYTPLFARCKARKELRPEHPNMVEGMKDYQAQPVQSPYQYPSPTPPAENSRTQLTSGIFCPYCGYNISSPKDFCPNCGDSIKTLNI